MRRSGRAPNSGVSMRRLPRAASKTRYWRSFSSGSYSSKIHERSWWMSTLRRPYRTGARGSSRELRQHEHPLDDRDVLCLLQPLDHRGGALFVPVEEARHLLRGDAARELEEAPQQRDGRVGG